VKARVHVCKLKETDELYAVKVMEKRFIVKEAKINFVNMEKKVLSMVNHPLVNRLYFSFHDKRYLYMVMDLCKGGELQQLISHRANEQLGTYGIKNRACSFEDTRFYLAETTHAIQYLHGLGFIHRDVKPDNILLCANGHIKLTDFGTVKDEREIETSAATMEKGRASSKSSTNSSSSAGSGRRGTFCGTAEYVSPEVLMDQEPSVGADLWAIGCLLYQLLTGAPPFRGGSEYLTFQLIMGHDSGESLKIKIPEIEFENPDQQRTNLSGSLTDDNIQIAEDLINRLLIADPIKRIGSSNNATRFNEQYVCDSNNGPEALRKHPLFQALDFENLVNTPAPAIPYRFEIPEPTFDGASGEWMLAGDITELELAAVLETPDAQRGNGGSGSMSRGSTSGELDQFLKEGEQVVLDGLVVKRRSLFHSNTRHLILTDLPRFIYIDPIKVVFKGEIPIDRHLCIQIKNNKSFDIVTPKRTYHMTDLMSHASRWESALKTSRETVK